MATFSVFDSTTTTDKPLILVGTGIAFDSAAGPALTLAGNSVSLSHSVMGSNTFLLAGVITSVNTNLVVTYNGVTMTQLITLATTGAGGRQMAIYGLQAPADGTHTLSVTSVTTQDIQLFSASYANVRQVTTMDATASGQAASGTTFAISATTKQDGALAFGLLRAEGGGIGSGSGTTMRTSGSSFSALFDGTVPVAAAGGSAALNGTASTGQWNALLVVMDPVPLSINVNDVVLVQDSRTNLVTNPGFETGSLFWTNGSFGTVTGLTFNMQDSSRSLFGTYSASFGIGPNDTAGYYLTSSAPYTPVVGQTYTFSAYVFIQAGSAITNAVISIEDYVSFTQLAFAFPPLVANAWTQISTTYTVKPTDSTLRFVVSDAFGNTVNDKFWVDATMLEISPTQGTYFDGAIAGSAWTGTAQQSTSVNAQSNVFLTEVWTPALLFDSVTVTESVTMRLNVLPTINDSVTVSENINLVLPTLFLAVFDSVTVSESITDQESVKFSVFDSVTVSESIQLIDLLMPSVSDSVTVSENISLKVPLPVNVFDSITVSENFASKVNTNLFVFDSVTVSESVTPSVQFKISVFDNVTVREQRTNLATNPSFETASAVFWVTGATSGTTTGLSENNHDATFALFGSFSGSKQAAFAGGTIATGQFYARANFTPIIGQTYTFSAYVFIPSGGHTTQIQAYIKSTSFATLTQSGNLNVTANTWTRVSAPSFTATAANPNWFFAVADPVIAGGGFTGTETWYIDGALVENDPNVNTYFDGTTSGANWSGTANQSASIMSSPMITIQEPLLISVSDSVTVSENVNVATNLPSILINVFDTVTVSDYRIAGQLLGMLSAVTYAATGAPAVTILIKNFGENIFDSITVSESITLLVKSFPSVSDSVTVSENINIVLPQLFMSVNDSVTTSESVTMRESSYISLFDSVAVSESVSIMLAVFGTLITESITVSESVALTIPKLFINVFDAVTVSENITTTSIADEALFDTVHVSESITMFLPSLSVSVFDEIQVFDFITGAYLITVFNISVFDSVNAVDFVNIEQTYNITLFDSIHVEEAFFSYKYRFSPQITPIGTIANTNGIGTAY